MAGPEIDEAVRAVVDSSAAPVVILALPSEEILAASPSARSLLADDGDIVGRSLEHFAEDRPTGALELLAAGRLTGYEAVRELRLKGTPGAVRLWVRKLGQDVPPRYVLVTFDQRGRPACVPAPSSLAESRLTPILGTTNSALEMTQISVDVETVLGRQPSDLLGKSLLSLFAPADTPALLWALAQTASGRTGVTLRLRAAVRHGPPVSCDVLLVALDPATAFGFAMVAGDESLDPLVQGQDMDQALWRLSRETLAVAASREAEGALAPAPEVLSRLSSRELEIVLRLLAGDRVPTIARSLFIAQGTVRNHLSSVFRRLGVSSQQELIAWLRGNGPRSQKP